MLSVLLSCPSVFWGQTCPYDGIWNASIPLGSALGIALGGVIATYLGWRHAFGLVAIPGFIVCHSIFFIKDYKTVELTKNSEGLVNNPSNPAEFAEIAGKIARTPTLYFAYFGLPWWFSLPHHVMFLRPSLQGSPALHLLRRDWWQAQSWSWP